jgi:hypothetical protein
VTTGKITLNDTTFVSARCFRDGNPVSPIVLALFKKVDPLPPVKTHVLQSGMNYAYYEGDWDKLPDFKALKPLKGGVSPDFDLSLRNRPEYFGLEYTGFLQVPETDVYEFSTDSDDGSRLYIGDSLVVDNDGLHGAQERKGAIALGAGLHPIRVVYFNKTGELSLKVGYASKKIKKQPIPNSMLFR